MGTFRIAAYGVISKAGIGSYALGAGGIVGVPSDANIIVIMNKFPFDIGFYISPWNANPSGSLLLSLDPTKFYLNGSGIPVDENHLPAGFNLRTASVEGTGGIAGDPTATCRLKLESSVGTSIANGYSGALNSLAYPSDLVFTLAGFLLTRFGLQWTDNNINTPLMFNAYVIGTYEIVSWTWQIASSAPYLPHTKLKISSGGGVTGDPDNIFSSSRNPSGTGPDLKGDFSSGGDSGDGISSIIFSWTDSNGASQSSTVSSSDFEDWTFYFFWFYLPDDLPTDTTITVTATSTKFPAIPVSGGGTGTQFSGSVTLGTLTVLGTKASGIYRLVADKTADTLYINSPVDNTTANFAIPDPFGKTGFIGG